VTSIQDADSLRTSYTEEINLMNESSKTPLVIAFVVVVVLFLIFSGGTIELLPKIRTDG
jgi:hypothetical protein